MYIFVNKVNLMKLNYTKHRLSNLLSINKIVTVHYYEFSKDFSFDGESHNFWEMVYVDKGQVNIQAGANTFTLKQGQVAFHKPNEFHTICTDGINAADVFVIAFVCNSSSMDFFKSNVTTLSSKLKKNMFSIIDESLSTFELMPITGVELLMKSNAPIGSQQMIRIHLEEFLILLMREASEKSSHVFFPTKESMENHIVTQIITIIEENVYSKISVYDLCSEMNYSRAYLSGIFKTSTGMTIGEYITKLKIKESKKLIRNGTYTFAEISDMLCFDNQHYFSRVFKKVTNFTPSQYKNSILK